MTRDEKSKVPFSRRPSLPTFFWGRVPLLGLTSLLEDLGSLVRLQMERMGGGPYPVSLGGVPTSTIDKQCPSLMWVFLKIGDRPLHRLLLVS